VRGVDQPAASGVREPARRFERALAAESGALHELDLTLAGMAARMRVVGGRLAADLTRAFAPALSARAAGPVELEIDVWDEAETGVHWPEEDKDGWEGGWELDGDLVWTSTDRRVLMGHGPHWHYRFARGESLIVGSVSSAAAQSIVELGRPLNLPLSLWHLDHGYRVIHAALVSRNGRGALIAGRMGAGKSTVALACLEAEYEFLGDDHVAVAVDGENDLGHGIYGAARLAAADLARFPALESASLEGAVATTEKLLIRLAELPGARFARATEIRALVLPRVGRGEGTQASEASGAETLLAMVPTSMFRQPLRLGTSGMEPLARLAERVPAYWLETGSDNGSIANAVDRVLAASRG
jgi:hypothetical protein